MKYNIFQKYLKKPVFSFQEATLVARDTSIAQFKIQLSQWVHQGHLLRLRRGVYCFANQVPDVGIIAQHVYSPSYISLVYALEHYGLIPDVPFGVTCVTPKATRVFETSLGRFTYQSIHPKYFFGYDVQTGWAEREKSILDYIYFHQSYLKTDPSCWKELRFQNLDKVNIKKLTSYANKMPSPRMKALVRSWVSYARS